MADGEYNNPICYDYGNGLSYIDVMELLNELHEENKQLKQKNTMLKIDLMYITNRKNYLENEWDKCYELIDKKIHKLEKKYEFGQNVVKTNCPMHNIQFGINVLKELRKELEE